MEKSLGLRAAPAAEGCVKTYCNVREAGHNRETVLPCRVVLHCRRAAGGEITRQSIVVLHVCVAQPTLTCVVCVSRGVSCHTVIGVCYIAPGGVTEFPKAPATTPARPLTPHHRPQTMSKKSKPADPTPPSVLEHRRSWSIRLYFDIKTGADVNAGVHHCLSCLVSMGRRTPTRCCVQNLVAFNGVLSSTIRIK